MRPAALALALALAGCNLAPYDLSSATADAASTSTSSTSTTSTSDPTDPTGADDSTTFTPPSRDHPPGWCDVWDDACPFDQKCTAVSLDGDNERESLRCVPLAPTPDGLNEPCTLLGTGSDGLDTCDRGLTCQFADWETKTGKCLGYCTGSPEEPVCADPDARCLLTGNAVGDLCHHTCDPLAQDCDPGGACLPFPMNSALFICMNEISGDDGQVLDRCEYLNSCDPGLLCANPALATECDPKGAGCCLPFCDTTEPNTCPGTGQECLPWYEDTQAPPEYEHIGVCGLP